MRRQHVSLKSIGLAGLIAALASSFACTPQPVKTKPIHPTDESIPSFVGGKDDPSEKIASGYELPGRDEPGTVSGSGVRVKVDPKARATTKTLVGKYSFGSTPRWVFMLLKKRLNAEYGPLLLKAKADPQQQDDLRNELKKKIVAAAKGFVKFDGAKTIYDSSIIDKEFTHKNNESMLTDIQQSQQRYYFFHRNRLFKIFIAFNQDHPKYKGLRFPQFVHMLKASFGQGKPIFRKNAAGDDDLAYVQWEGGADIQVRAVDRTTVYGNFCLVLENKVLAKEVNEGRSLVKKGTTDTTGVKGILRKDADQE